MGRILEPGDATEVLSQGEESGGMVWFTFQKDRPCCAGYTRMGKARSGRKPRDDCGSGLGGWTGEVLGLRYRRPWGWVRDGRSEGGVQVTSRG